MVKDGHTRYAFAAQRPRPPRPPRQQLRHRSHDHRGLHASICSTAASATTASTPEFVARRPRPPRPPPYGDCRETHIFDLNRSHGATCIPSQNRLRCLQFSIRLGSLLGLTVPLKGRRWSQNVTTYSTASLNIQSTSNRLNCALHGKSY